MPSLYARVAESVDATDLKSVGGNSVEVQVLSRAPIYSSIAQLASAFGSYSKGHWFESNWSYQKGDNMNVIFLDIDGVVNTLMIDIKPFETDRGQISRDGFYYKLNMPDDEEVSNRQAVMWLNKLCKETNAKIVITSTWRLGDNGLKKTKKALYNSGLLKEIEIIGGTPRKYNYNNIRGYEIEEYLNQHPEIDNYVIIDDDLDMLTKQMNNFVVTDTNIGMTYNTYIRAKEILNVGSTCDKD